MKIKVNDQVLITTGKEKGKTGKVLKVSKKNNSVIVEGANIKTKHVKKRYNQAGEKVTFEGPIDASNVSVIDPKTNKPTRIKYKKLKTGKKERVTVKSESSLDNLKSKKTKA